MFKSSLESVTKTRSVLGLQPKRKVLVILVDGMGAENISARAGHAPRLARAVAEGAVSYASFPSTTSTNITGLATGLRPGEHGFIGQTVRDAGFERNLNLLNGWDSDTDPLLWQPHKTVSELAFELGVRCNVIAAEEYRFTGFTNATMRGASFHAADSLEQRFERALELISSTEDSINYLYVPELDKFGHLNGWEGFGWGILLEQIAGLIDAIVAKLPADAGIIVTADHGMVDTNDDRRIELAEILDSLGVGFFGGDTRASFVYLQDGIDTQEALRSLQDQQLFSAHRAVDLEGWFGGFGTQALNRLPELVLLAKPGYTLYHRGFSKPSSYRMTAHHGGITPMELRVPLIRFGL